MKHPNSSRDAVAPGPRARWTRGAKLLLLPGAVVQVAFLAGLLYIMGGPTSASREQFVPAMVGFVLLQLIVAVRMVETWQARGFVLTAAALLAVASAGLALALPDDRTAALMLTAGALGMVGLLLAAAVVEIATGQEMV